MHLTNKVALVTSSQRPRCAQIARQLASAGASVVICGRNTTKGRATVAEIQRSGGKARFILADISAPADIRAAINETIATYGRLDVLFNYVSSFYDCDQALGKVTENTWDRMLEVALKGIFFCCQYALPFLEKPGCGRIITLIRYEAPIENHALSRICQGGLVELTQAIAQQFPNRHVIANLIIHQPETATVPPLFTEHILYADTEFRSVDDAIDCLIHRENQLQGHTLVGHLLCR